MTLKQFLKPDWRKIVLFLIISCVAIIPIINGLCIYDWFEFYSSKYPISEIPLHLSLVYPFGSFLKNFELISHYDFFEYYCSLLRLEGREIFNSLSFISVITLYLLFLPSLLSILIPFLNVYVIFIFNFIYWYFLSCFIILIWDRYKKELKMNWKQFLKPCVKKIIIFAIILLSSWYFLIGLDDVKRYIDCCSSVEALEECASKDIVYKHTRFAFCANLQRNLFISVILTYIISCLVIWIYISRKSTEEYDKLKEKWVSRMKGQSSIAIIIILVVLAVIGGTYYVTKQKQPTTITTTTITTFTTTSTTSTTTIPPTTSTTTSSTTTSTLPITTTSMPTCTPNYVKIGTISKSTLEALGADDYDETCKYHFCRNQYEVTSYKIEMTTYYGEEAADCYCDLNDCNP